MKDHKITPHDSNEPKRVLLVEDHPLYADGITHVLRSLAIPVEATCVDSVELSLVRLRDQRFDLILLDLTLSDGTGHALLNAIETGPLFTPIVIISGTDDMSAVDHAISLGACAYLSKTASSDHLRETLQEYLTLGHTKNACNRAFQQPHQAMINITERQRKVIACMADGMPNKSIARALNISENTVKYHVKVLYGLLAVRTRTECLKRASRLGWMK